MSSTPLDALLRSRLLRLVESMPSRAAAQRAVEALASHAETTSFAAGELVLREGDVTDRVFAVVDGEAEAVREATGEVLHVFRPGEVFSERALLFPDEPVGATVRAAANGKGARIMHATKHAFETYFRDSFARVRVASKQAKEGETTFWGRAVRAMATKSLKSLDSDLGEFRGIKYAQAGRFEMPRPEAYPKRVDAFQFGPQCAQMSTSVFAQLAEKPSKDNIPSQLVFYDKQTHPPPTTTPSSEDCLFLNVTAPLHAATEGHGSLPVAVWIHGGAFITGSGHEPLYQARNLASRGGLVVVTINYRLGPLGFFPMMPGVTPNLGLWDQVQALRWVKQHIHAFGGDPNNVTAFGESAGSMSVVSLLGSRVRREEQLFQHAIAQSGGEYTLNQAQAEESRDLTVRGLLQLSKDQVAKLTPAEQLRQLKELPIEVLIQRSEKSLGLNPKTSAYLRGKFMVFQPVCLEDSPPSAEPLFQGTPPLTAITRGIANDVDLMTGVLASEYTLFMMDGAWRRVVAKANGNFEAFKSVMASWVQAWIHRDARYHDVADARAVARHIVDVYAARALAVGNGDFDASAERLFERLHSVWVFDKPADLLVAAHRRGALTAAHGARKVGTFAYRIHFESPVEAVRAGHAVDLPLVFGNDDVASTFLAGSVDDPNRVRVSNEVQRAWIRFFKSGQPGWSASKTRVFGDPVTKAEFTSSDASGMFATLEEKRAWDGVCAPAALSLTAVTGELALSRARM